MMTKLPNPQWHTLDFNGPADEVPVELMVFLDAPLAGVPPVRTSSDDALGDLRIHYDESAASPLQEALIECDPAYLRLFEERGRERIEWHIKLDAIAALHAERADESLVGIVGQIRVDYDLTRRPKLG